MDLTPEERKQYVAIIDNILRESDLKTISAKAIRKALSDKLGKDISDQKAAVKLLIEERFDRISAITPPTSADDAANAKQSDANGHTKLEISNRVKKEPLKVSHDVPTPRSASDNSDIDMGPPKKKRKQADSDAKLAAKLQAEENSRARPSRGGVVKKAVVSRKKTSPKKKSAAKVKADDDSDIELDSNGEAKEVSRKGGFHKEYLLSEPLVALVGETKLSRPQTVKKVWNHIKALNLQDPNDKRQILCDDKMYAVFKQDKVHMFTMNKILGKHLYEVEEAQGAA